MRDLPGVRTVRCCHGIGEIFNVDDRVLPGTYKVNQRYHDNTMHEKPSNGSSHKITQHLESLSDVTHACYLGSDQTADSNGRDPKETKWRRP